MSDPQQPRQNLLFDSLRGDERTRIFAKLELVPLTLGEIQERMRPPGYVCGDERKLSGRLSLMRQRP